MSKLDDILQKRLEELEHGKPLEEVLENLPQQDQQLIPLIRLVDQTRSIPHPELSQEKAKSQQEKVVAEFITARSSGNAFHKKRSGVHLGFSWSALGDLVLQPSWKTGLAVGVLAVFAAVGVWFYNAGPVSAHSASLANVTGVVELSGPQTQAVETFATPGGKVHEGQSIHTFSGSSATIEFYDGSQTVIGPDTTVMLTKLDGGWNKSLQIQISQEIGTTVHNVVPLKSSSSFYLVTTPSGQASVHGTIFEVDVNTDGISLFTVDRGKVQVDGSGDQVYLTAGQTTMVVPNAFPLTPSFQFFLQGEISSITDNQWMVAGVTFSINDQTTFLNQLVQGDFVSARGRIQANGEWIADQIALVSKRNEKARFTGLVKVMGNETWKVGGKTLAVNSKTEIDSGLRVGDAVEVSFNVQPDGTWLATSIGTQISVIVQRKPPPGDTQTSMNPAGQGPTDTDTVGPNNEGATESSTNQNSGAQNNSNSCTNPDFIQPDGQTIAERYNVAYTEIMDWFCQGHGFGEIDLAYSLSEEYSTTDIAMPVDEIFAMRSSGMGWGQIEQQLKDDAKKVKPVQPANGQGKPPTPTPRPTNENRPTKQSPGDKKP